METKTPKKQNQLDKLKQQRDVLNARIQAAEARQRISERKKQTRRKILIGAYYLEQAQKNPHQWDQLQQIMINYLTRDIDRQLFESLPFIALPEKIKSEEE